ncbi:MAG: UDP-glucose/GDP-mannose dehydrogenase family protein [Bdellovibrionaceae bacterium]|nr:UDP-glucose/GDP-mannose dehydrogenase family protein [Bdellovibrionales bacterium]MCB9084710.1 UDP-glucose/GDP-mannose dehydrogenase family protein [Pseudobdellovibrionaceae bacterium]
MDIAMVGTGYVGLVAGVCFADAGHRVICVDSNKDKVSQLLDGKLPFYEPGLSDLFLRNYKRMKFVYSVAEATEKADTIFIAVGTPELPDGSADMSFTFNVLKEICESSITPKTVILKSTVPIGTAKKAQAFCAERAKVDIEIVNNPEFLKQGAAVNDFLRPDRVVIGCRTEKAKQLMTKLYEPFVKNGHPILFMDNASAETTKYAANSFLALKISFINELSLLADKVGADINEVRRGFTSDSRINPAFFYPGIGYGGSCFPKDVRALVHTGEEHDVDMKLLKAADEVNERQKTILAQRVKGRFGDLKGKTIALWGLSFKPHTDDVRRAPSLKLIEDLVSQGAMVKAYDPVALKNAQSSCQATFEASESATEAAKGADALVLVTEWNEFKSADLQELKSLMNTPIVFDGRNIYDPGKMKSLGFEYYGIGRQALAENER